MDKSPFYTPGLLATSAAMSRHIQDHSDDVNFVLSVGDNVCTRRYGRRTERNTNFYVSRVVILSETEPRNNPFEMGSFRCPKTHTYAYLYE